MLKDLLFYLLSLLFGAVASVQALAVGFLFFDAIKLDDVAFLYREPAIAFLTINCIACVLASLMCWVQANSTEKTSTLHVRR